MGSNLFGQIFRILTWGESHGKAIGVVIDGCPAGLELSEEEIGYALAKRAPGTNLYVSARKEDDLPQILSGVFEGKTTGAPLSILIPNHDADSTKYAALSTLFRPGHATYTYLEKYGIFDYRGGGRASARETACRVAAGAVAQKLLTREGIECLAYLKQVGPEKIDFSWENLSHIEESSLFCPDPSKEESLKKIILEAKEEGDSLGGVVGFIALGLPVGLGDPLYEKLEANLAKAMLSLPASKGFEIGEGFHAATLKGSVHNDAFIEKEGRVFPETNHAGGVLAGISTGMPLEGAVAFKPPSSIQKTQKTVSVVDKKELLFELPPGSRHDPCVAIRAVPVVKAMLQLVLADALLMNKMAKI